MRKVRVGLLGSGFVAELHMHAYKRVYGVDAEVAAVVSRGDHVKDFARRHGIGETHRDYRALLAAPAIDVVDICTPPALHAAMECVAEGRQPLADLALAYETMRVQYAEEGRRIKL
jgi:predicted dehydrogenase